MIYGLLTRSDNTPLNHTHQNSTEQVVLVDENARAHLANEYERTKQMLFELRQISKQLQTSTSSGTPSRAQVGNSNNKNINNNKGPADCEVRVQGVGHLSSCRGMSCIERFASHT